MQAILEEEAIKHGGRMAVLSKKITRTREALRNLENAKSNYDHSAQKVYTTEARLKAVENKMKSNQRKSIAVPAAIDKRATRKLRCELDEATAMMAAAFRRVEQIETLTDHLIHQLADAEEELAEVTALRQEENEQHSSEIERLTKEKNEASKQLCEVRMKEASLRKELARAAKAADQLADQVESEGRMRDEIERRLLEQRQALERSLEEAKAREQALCGEIATKEKELEEAASQGTPVGNGAKIVLPMALQRIRETQHALEEETRKKSAVEAELESLKKEMTNRVQELEAERVRQVAEKQASLESMTRVVATATTEAAIAQDALRTFEREANAKIVALEATYASALWQHEEKSRVQTEKDIARIVAHCIVQGAISKALALGSLTSEFNGRLNSANASIVALKQGLEVTRGEAAALQKQLIQVQENGEDQVAALETQLKAVCSQRDATMMALEESSAAAETALSQLRATGMALQDRAQAAESALLEKQRSLDAAMDQMREIVRAKELLQEHCLEQASMVLALQADLQSQQIQNNKYQASDFKGRMPSSFNVKSIPHLLDTHHLSLFPYQLLQEDIEMLEQKIEETKIAAEIAASKQTASLERCLLATQRRLGIISSVNEELIDVFKAREKAIVEVWRVAAAREAEITRVMRASEDKIQTLLERTQLEVFTSEAHANSTLEMVHAGARQTHQADSACLSKPDETQRSKSTTVTSSDKQVSNTTSNQRVKEVVKKTSRKTGTAPLTNEEGKLEKNVKKDGCTTHSTISERGGKGPSSNHSVIRRSSTVAAVVACAMAILWSSAVGGEERVGGKEGTLQMRKITQG